MSALLPPLEVYATPIGVLVVVTGLLALRRLWFGGPHDDEPPRRVRARDARDDADPVTRYWTGFSDGTSSRAVDPLEERTTAWPRPTATYRNRPSIWPASAGAERPAWATSLTAALDTLDPGDPGESTRPFDVGEVFDVMSRPDVDAEAEAFFRADPLNALSLPLDLEPSVISVDTFVDLVHAGQLTGSLNDTRSLDWRSWGYELRHELDDPEDPDDPDLEDEDEEDEDELVDAELDEMMRQPALAGAH